MKSRSVAAMALAALALGACEDGAPEPERKQIVAANPTSDGLKGLSEMYRYLGLRRAIVENGQRCKKVDRGAYQEQYRTMAMWTAHCTDTGDWAIYIAPAGTVQVRRCGNLARVGLPPCRIEAAAPASKDAPATKAPR